MPASKVDVSVIIPTYNRAYIISWAIQSVLNQTYQNFEIIVVDDGSTDNTQVIVESIHDDRIKYIRCEKNAGHATARNIGIRASVGKYIASVDSDDEWLPEKLEKQCSAFAAASPQVGIVNVCLLNIVGKVETHVPPKYAKAREGNLYHEIIIDNIQVSPTSAMIRRECFEKVGMFDESFRAGPDWDLWIRIAKYYQFKYVDEILAIRTVISDSITTTRKDSRVREMILAKHLEDISRDKRILSRFYVKTGHCFCLEKQLDRGRYYFMQAARAYPLGIESPILAYIATLPGQWGYEFAQVSYKKLREWWSAMRR